MTLLHKKKSSGNEIDAGQSTNVKNGDVTGNSTGLTTTEANSASEETPSPDNVDWRRNADNIEIKPALSLIGVKTRFDSSDGQDNYEKVKAFFNTCEENGTLARLRAIADPEWQCYFAACTNFAKKSYDYWITVAVPRKEDEKLDIPTGFEDLYTEEGEFAIFHATGAAPESVSSCWRTIYNDWFVNHEYVHLDKPELELYPFGDMANDDYCVDIWVPIKLAPIRKPPNRRGQMTLFFSMLVGVTGGALFGSVIGNMMLGVVIGAMCGAVVGNMLRKKVEEKDDNDNK